jgi:RNA polymerase sigma factor (sigma-70 family)
MSTDQLGRVVRRLKAGSTVRAMTGVDDADLCARYVRQRDEATFELLVRRHGPLVLKVCRRILRHEQDAEDAFQATFLVLVRRIAGLRSPGRLANWLFGVARRTALAAKRNAEKRRQKESAVRPRAHVPDDGEPLGPILDQELARLADKFRLPILLCDLQTMTRKDAARRLGWAEGTVASRLARGRGLLAKHLARRGFAGALVAAALSESPAAADLRPGLVARTVAAAGFRSVREAATNGAASGAVAALTEGVLQTMVFTKAKIATAWLLLVGVATIGTGALIAQGPGRPPDADRQTRSDDTTDVRDRLADLNRQVKDLQDRIAGLERKPAAERRRDGFPNDQFKHRVAVEIGQTETAHGGRIEITEVWGTRPRIEVGGLYVVRGRYRLPPGERGKLYFYETATGGWGNRATPTMDLQSADVDGESGEFELMHGMGGPGYFHLYLAERDKYSRFFANVYFGTGDNVLRKTAK